MTAVAADPRHGSVAMLSQRSVGYAAAVLFVTAIATAWIAPLFDPDEGYYPATAVESMDAGSAWDLKFNGAPRWDKPILTYALVETSFLALGRSVPAARLPSILEGVLLVLIVGFLVYRIAGPQPAGLAAWTLCTTLGVQIFSRVAHPEIAVVLMITTTELLAVLWLTTLRSEVQLRIALVAGIALGLGVLAKGPVAIALPFLAIGTGSLLMYGRFRPSAQAVRHLLLCGLIGAAVAVPWYAAMTSRYGIRFLEEAVWRHNVGRFAGEAFVHRAAPWFFLLPTLVAMFPWSGFVPASIWRASRKHRDPIEVLRFFMAIAAMTSFAFYSASGSQLAHYALVFVPPLSILIALYLDDQLAKNGRVVKPVWTAAIMILVAGMFAVAPFLVNRAISAGAILDGLSNSGTDLIWMFARALWPPALLLASTAVLVSFLRPVAALRLLMIAGAVLPAMLIIGAQPLLARAYPWERFGPLIRKTDLPVWLIGPRAPSLNFYAGRSVIRLSESEAEWRTLPQHEAWVVADSDWLSRRVAIDQSDHQWQLQESFGGMTLARWHGERRASHKHTR